VPDSLEGVVDVVVGVLPYVPTTALAWLPRDTLDYEPRRAHDGGDDGTDILRRAVRQSPRYLRPGGAILLELGADEADLLADDLARRHFTAVEVLVDEDGDVRGIEATLR
jgi:release factor glutamine methyltransferase